EVVWELTKRIWMKTGEEWPDHLCGTILAHGLADYKTPKGEPDTPKNCRFEILMTEAARLIWKVRCKTTNKEPAIEITNSEICNRWVKVLAQRTLMVLLATHIGRYKRDQAPFRLGSKIWGSEVC
ncbi:hypothetical protein BU17DRAFT_43333, partial [Hysterangium stoloniferum]